MFDCQAVASAKADARNRTPYFGRRREENAQRSTSNAQRSMVEAVHRTAMAIEVNRRYLQKRLAPTLARESRTV